MVKQHEQKFKEDAVEYYNTHKALGVKGCATNLGIGYSALQKWLKQFKETGSVPTRGQGNYDSDEYDEIALLKRELCDTKDALDVLKKSYQHSGKITPAIYQGVKFLKMANAF